MATMKPMSEMSDEWRGNMIDKAERLKKPDMSYGCKFKFTGDEPLQEFTADIFYTIVVPTINIALPDLHLLTVFSHPDGFGAFGIAPFAGVFLIFSVESEGFTVTSESIDEEQQYILVKNTCPKDDKNPLDDFKEMIDVHRRYEKPEKKPDIDIYAFGVDADSRARDAFIAQKHIYDYHVIPLNP